MQITREDLWIRTYGRLYQKLCSTTCEIPIGIYRTTDSQSLAEEDYYETEEARRGSYGDPPPAGDGSRDSPPTGTPFSSSESTFKKLSAAMHQGKNLNDYKNAIYRRCFRGTCGSDESSFTSAALTVNEELRDSHAQLIERAEISNLVRSRMQSLGLPWEDMDLHMSEKRDSLSYVIINPSCDLKIREGDIIYLIRPTPFSATKTFERHNSRRKSTLNPPGSGGGPGGNSGMGQGLMSGGGGPDAVELQKAAFSLFQDRGSCASMSRRRSSSGNLCPCT